MRERERERLRAGKDRKEEERNTCLLSLCEPLTMTCVIWYPCLLTLNHLFKLGVKSKGFKIFLLIQVCNKSVNKNILKLKPSETVQHFTQRAATAMNKQGQVDSNQAHKHKQLHPSTHSSYSQSLSQGKYPLKQTPIP